jgi:thiosulfate sulfurtransferase
VDDIKEITADEALKFFESGRAIFIDARDPASHEAAHVPGSKFLTDANVGDFITKTDKRKPIVVYCYHGHTSLGVAAYLQDQGFYEVYSLICGFERWRQTGKIES